MKQEELADKLNLSQQAISKIEQKEIIEDEILNNVAQALNRSVDTIKISKKTLLSMLSLIVSQAQILQL